MLPCTSHFDHHSIEVKLPDRRRQVPAVLRREYERSRGQKEFALSLSLSLVYVRGGLEEYGARVPPDGFHFCPPMRHHGWATSMPVTYKATYCIGPDYGSIAVPSPFPAMPCFCRNESRHCDSYLCRPRISRSSSAAHYGAVSERRGGGPSCFSTATLGARRCYQSGSGHARML